EFVAQEFDKLLGGKKPCSRCNGGSANPVPADLSDLIDELPPAFAERIRDWCENPRVTALRDETRARLRQLVQRTGQWLREPDSEAPGQIGHHV
ncbi:hypothetical protein, partial [Vibrio parahaemolyticus]|uniref:hypothetical protein n=1 Tax=Vibrio parahaemolyticus TaxID=670 RepID=UPI00211143D9